MNAIVLTFDEQIGFAELVYKKYMELWPGCPFNFRIAYNCGENIPDSIKQKNVELINTSPDIRSTMRGLLSGIPDDDWVYWCIDDRYPISIDVETMQSICEFIKSGEARSLNSIKLIHWNEEKLSSYTKTINNITFNYQVWRPKGNFFGFWHHRYTKAKTLKLIFLGKLLPQIYKVIDVQLFHELENVEAQRNIIYPANEPIITLAEPCKRGKLTINGFESLKKHNCKIPNYKHFDCSIYFQNPPRVEKYPTRG